MGSTATIGQEVQEIADTIKVDPAQVGGDPADTGAALAT
jgi:hypothetical protein